MRKVASGLQDDARRPPPSERRERRTMRHLKAFDKHTAMLTLAAGMFWAWYDLSQLYSLPPQDMSAYVTPLFMLFSACNLVFLAAGAMFPERALRLTERRPLAVIGLGGAASYALEAFGMHGGYAACMFLGAAGAGLASGAITTVLAAMVGAKGSRTVGLVTAGSFSLEAAIDIVACNAPAYAFVATCLLLPIACTALLAVSKEGAEKSLAGPRAATRMQQGDKPPSASLLLKGVGTTLLVAFACYWFACGFFEYWLTTSASAAASNSSELIIARGTAAIVFFVGSAWAGWRQQSILRVGLLVMIAGCMATPLCMQFGIPLRTIGFVIIAGYGLFDIMSWVILSNVAAYHGISPVRTICIGMFAGSLFMGTGMAAALGLDSAVSQGALIQACMTVVTYLLVVGAVLALVDLSNVWNNIPEGIDAQAAKAEEVTRLAQEYNLTNRETEVLLELLSNKSMAGIAEDMFVSNNTVKTHVRRIYVKFGVHSRAELIDFVNGWLA